MFRHACTFCSHHNPEGSRFCNRCGSPLHLVPCPQCEAINNQADTRCYACGTALRGEPVEELAIAGGAEATAGDAGPSPSSPAPAITLRNRLEDIAWDVPAPARPVAAPAAAPVAEATATDADALYATEDPQLLPYRYRRTHPKGATTRWPKRIVLGCALVAIAGAIAWSTLQVPTSWLNVVPMRWLTPAPKPVSTPAFAPSAAPAANAHSDPAPSSPSPASPAELPAPSSTSAASPAAQLAPSSGSPAPPAADLAPSPATSPVPPERPTDREAPSSSADKSAAEPAATTAPPVVDKAGTAAEPDHRATASARSREQARRDALATQRLIERDLGIAPRAHVQSATSSSR